MDYVVQVLRETAPEGYIPPWAEDMIIRIPQEKRFPAAIPEEEMEIVSAWTMRDGKVGVWLGIPGKKIGQRWPLTGVTPDELEAWRVNE